MADISIYGALRSMTGEGKAAYASQIYDEALGKFQSEINQEGGGGGGAGAYMVTYGTSTYSEISTAVAAGKVVACYYSDRLYLYGYLSTYHYLICASTSTIYYIRVNSSNTWSNSSTNIESSGNKVSSWSVTPNDTRYPTEKLVKDSLDAKYVKPSSGIPASDLESGVIPDVSGKEDTSNKTSDISTNKTSTTKYPTTKGVADYAEAKMAIVAASGTALTASVDNYYLFSSEVGTLAITLTTPTDTTHITKAVFMMTTGSSPAVTFAGASGINVIAQDGFSIEASTTYEINVIYNGASWIVAAIKLSTTPINS